MELTTCTKSEYLCNTLFMMSKIQNLNGTHNPTIDADDKAKVVYDVKDTKFEWNSQLSILDFVLILVVYDVKDTKFEWNSQHACGCDGTGAGCL